MPRIPIPFPTSSSGGVLSHASGGRIVNAMAQKLTGSMDGGIVYVRAPGLLPAFSVDAFTFRGALDMDGAAYVVMSNACFYVTMAGGAYTVTRIGSIPGDQPITIARNMKAPTPDVLCVHEYGISSLSPTAVTVFNSPNLRGAPNSISFVGSYFVLTFPNGEMQVSGINDTTFNALDFATAESAPDGLLRGARRGLSKEMAFFGKDSTEFWAQNSAEVGFPFSFVTAIEGGIIGPYAVTRQPADGGLVYVCSDRTIRAGAGYQPSIISTMDVQRAVDRDPNPAGIRLSAFTGNDGVSQIAVNLTNTTWVYDTRHGTWHQRESFGLERWRASGAFRAFDRWLAGDYETGQIYEISNQAYSEGASELIWEVESGPAKSFPQRAAVSRADFDFSTGQGYLPWANEPERNPQVMISWSLDGGVTFPYSVQRPLGQAGQYTGRVSVRRVGALGPQGIRWRVRVSDPVPLTLLGGTMDFEARAA